MLNSLMDGDAVELILLVVYNPTNSQYTLRSRMSSKCAKIVSLKKSEVSFCESLGAISLHYQSGASFVHDAEVFVPSPLTQSKKG